MDDQQVQPRRTSAVIAHDLQGVYLDMEAEAQANGGQIPDRLLFAEHALLAELEGKGLAVMQVCAHLEGESEKLAELGRRLIAASKARANEAERVKAYFLKSLAASNVNELVGEDGLRFVRRRNTLGVNVNDPKLVYMTQPKACGLEPAEDCVVVDGQAMRVKPDKVALRKLLEEGEAIVAGAHLNEPTYRLEIKP